MSLILEEIFKLLSKFAIFFWNNCELLNLISNLDLNFFFILEIGESTGPITSNSLIEFNFIFISCAPLKLSSFELDEIITAISLEKGGSLLFFLKINSF